MTQQDSFHELENKAWQAYLLQELTSPAEALLQQAEELFGLSLNAKTCDEVASKLVDRARRLLQLVQEIPSTADLTHEQIRTLRHDLRGAAGYIVSACEDQLETVPSSHPLNVCFTNTLQLAVDVIKRLETILSPDQQKPDDQLTPVDSMQVSLSKLPLTVAQTTAHLDRSEPGTIMLIDDNQFSSELTAKMLRSQGHEIVTVPRASTAQQLLNHQQLEQIDTIICDVMMPEMTGLEFLIWLKSSPDFWGIPVILISALGDHESILAGIAAGAEDYLTRPVNPALLRARIASSLEKKRLRDRELEYQRKIDRLVNAIFPAAVVKEWNETGKIQPKRHNHIGVLFLDIVGFTQWCEERRHEPELVVQQLQSLVSSFESSAKKHQVLKIKTIGDAFMAASGLSVEEAYPARSLLAFALELIDNVCHHASGWRVRIGIHVGPVVSGILGDQQFSFDVWGHTVNAAARAESHGLMNRVTLTQEAWEEVQEIALGTPRVVAARGLGSVTLWDFEQFKLG